MVNMKYTVKSLWLPNDVTMFLAKYSKISYITPCQGKKTHKKYNMLARQFILTTTFQLGE